MEHSGEGTETAPRRGCLGKADSSLKVLQPQPRVGAQAALTPSSALPPCYPPPAPGMEVPPFPMAQRVQGLLSSF